MSGLDRILEELAQDAREAAQQKRKEARESAEHTLLRAREQAKAIEVEAAQQAELEYRRILTRAQSTGDISSKAVLLREKQRIIDDILHDAHLRIVGLDDKAYFVFLTRLLEKYAGGSRGTLLLSPRDRARVPQQFIEAARAKGLSVSEETRDIDGGFVLCYGNIEENCSFEALMEAEQDRLHDAVKAFLFDQG